MSVFFRFLETTVVCIEDARFVLDGVESTLILPGNGLWEMTMGPGFTGQ